MAPASVVGLVERLGNVHRSSMLEKRALEALEDCPVDVGEAVDIAVLASTATCGRRRSPLLERVMGETPPDGLDDWLDRCGSSRLVPRRPGPPA